MKLVKSKQRGVKFIWCSSPITIDKRAAWGDSADNLQIAKDGAFLKINDDGSVSHLVQPNADKTAPIGWHKSDDGIGYDKLPIWVADEVLEAGTVHKMNTADGPIEYSVTEPSRVCYNDNGGQPNMSDGWVQTEKNLAKNYEI